MAENKTAASSQSNTQSSTRGGSAVEVRSSNGSQTGSPARSDRQLARSDDFVGSPFSMMRRMAREMDRAFDRLFDDFLPWRERRSSGRGGALAYDWEPRIEAYQEQDRFIVRAELPGMKKDDLQVEVTEDAVTIQGERRQERRDERQGYYQSEWSYGSFYREIPLPEGALPDSADATFKDGVLQVTVQAPPHEVRHGRRIEINDRTS